MGRTPLPRSVDAVAEVTVNAPQTSTQLQRVTLQLHASCRLRVFHNGEVIVDSFRMGLTCASNPKLDAKIQMEFTACTIEALLNWIEHLSWAEWCNKLNPMRTWSPDKGGYTLKEAGEFALLKSRFRDALKKELR